MTRFVIAPQWQGSPAARAMLLVDGAEAIAGDLPRARTTRVEVPLEAGEALGTRVLRLSALTRTRDAIADALLGHEEPVVVVGGDGGVAVPAIAHASAHHPELAVVWLDAHGALNSPDTSPSGAYSGMALRAVLGEGELALADPIPVDRVVLAGARALDDGEAEFAAASRIRTLAVDDLAAPDALADAVVSTGATAVYVHVDLDVVDPADLAGLTDAVPFGVAAGALIATLKSLRARVPLAGASIAGFAPATPAAAVDDLATILRIVGAVA
ncbi:arginase family protein [Microbacterium sp.]|uniref:arginase family protein n=1 Tax=Microbacterium sp. TaxID=51671 RepID=UPI0039E6B74C